MFQKSWLKVIIYPIVIALILYFVVFPYFENQAKSRFFDRFIGTWESNSKNVTIIINEDETYISKNNENTYRGVCKISRYYAGYSITINWEGFSADYMALFTNDQTLRLVGINAPAGLVYLSKK
jgi:hypothetical protein